MSTDADGEPEYAWFERLIEDCAKQFYLTVYGAFALTYRCFFSSSSLRSGEGEDSLRS